MARRRDMRWKKARLFYPPRIMPGTEKRRTVMLDHQQEFHYTHKKVRLAHWGRGAGKTMAGVHELGINAHRHPDRVGVYVGATRPMLKKTLVPKIETWLAWYARFNGFRLEERYYKTDMIYKLITGAEWWLIPSDDPIKVLGQEFGYVGLDEASRLFMQPDLYVNLMGGMRMYPDWRLWATTTWHPDSYICQHIAEECRRQNPDYWIRGDVSSYANPFSDHKHWDNMKSEYSPDEFEREVMGAQTALGGSVYGSFFSPKDSIAHHLRSTEDVKRMVQRGGQYSILGGVDWGPRYSNLIVILRDELNDVDTVIDELILDDKSLDQSVGMIAERCLSCASRFGVSMRGCAVDPSGRAWNDQFRRKVRPTIHVAFNLCHAEQEIVYGVELVKRRLLAADGHRRLMFAGYLQRTQDNGPRGRGILQGVQRYKHSQTMDGAFRSKPKDDEYWVHQCDGLRYVYLNFPADRIVDPSARFR